MNRDSSASQVPTITDLRGLLQSWAGLGDTEMAALMRRFGAAGLVPASRRGAVAPAIAVSDAVWLVLGLMVGGSPNGAVKRARQLANLVNSRQTIGDVQISDGDPEITVFSGLRDIINLRRSGAIILAGDFRLTEYGGTVSAMIRAEMVLHAPLLEFPPGSRIVSSFLFGSQSPPPNGATLCRWAIVTMDVFNTLAGIFGPLPAPSESMGVGIGVGPVPAGAATSYQAETLH